MANKIVGNSSGYIAEVNASNQLKVVSETAPGTNPGNVGAVKMYTEIDSGAITGTPLLRSPSTSPDSRLEVGIDTPMLNEVFNMTAQNTAMWQYNTATTAVTYSSGFIVFAGGTAGTHYADYVSYRHIPLMGDGALHWEATGNITASLVVNQVFEAGLFKHPGASVAPADGVFFRLTPTGLYGVFMNNGTEVITGLLYAAASMTANVNAQYKMVITQRKTEFYVNDVLLGTLDTGTGNGQPFLIEALPVAFQLRCTGVVSGASSVKIGNVHVTQKDLALGKLYSTICANNGQMAYQGQDGGTMGTSALYTNSLAPGAGAVMTNTTAALGSGLGGQFAALPTLAANTDGILCSFQNPIGSISQTPRTLIIRGVKISSVVSTVLVGNATPVIYAYSLAFGHTAVSLATAEAATTKAARRIALGFETFAAAAALGTLGSQNGVYMQFDHPVVVFPGEFIAIAAKNIGVVTTTGVITFHVSYDAYYE